MSLSGPLRVVVVGGNGFLGSAVCRAALANNMQVTSVSSSGRPYQTPNGHKPAWTDKVVWHKGDALAPPTFSSLLDGAYAVVHTLGTLFEPTSSGKSYKTAIRENDMSALFQTVAERFKSPNPLESKDSESTYDTINRDSALRVFETFLASSSTDVGQKRPFVYISAEDVFRPFVPAQYIISKRQAEQALYERMKGKQDLFKTIYVRPGLIYHAHQRPLTTLPAALLDLSAKLHEQIPSPFPTPAGFLRTVSDSVEGGIRSSDLSDSSPLASVANALTIRPMHVDQVAKAIVTALQPNRPDVTGVLDVSDMLELIWQKRNVVDLGETKTRTSMD